MEAIIFWFIVGAVPLVPVVLFLLLVED